MRPQTHLLVIHRHDLLRCGWVDRENPLALPVLWRGYCFSTYPRITLLSGQAVSIPALSFSHASHGSFESGLSWSSNMVTSLANSLRICHLM
jgi:hypothetical protein